MKYEPFHLDDEFEINGEKYQLETVRMFPLKHGAEYIDYPFYTLLWKGKPSEPLLETGHRNVREAEVYHKELANGLSGSRAEKILNLFCTNEKC